MTEKEKYNSLEEYLVQGEPGQRERATNWAVGIGLQDVDGLKTSDYLQQIAVRNVEGEITIDEAQQLISKYYVEHGHAAPVGEEEADKVASNIARVLGEKAFSMSTEGFASIHRRIFTGVYTFAGEFRKVNIIKSEWVLNGDTVIYAPFEDIKATLDYDINLEKEFTYKSLSQARVVEHFSRFISGIWQIHPFREGNTRVTAIFAIKYLRSLGFNANNRPFEQNAKYFRDALVRANYRNIVKGIDIDLTGLTNFLENILFGAKHELKKRYLHIDATKLGLVETTPHVPLMYPPCTPHVKTVVKALDKYTLSASQLREKIGLKDRKNFTAIYLKPAIESGFVKLLFPDTPKSNRQKYLLTPQGLTLLNHLTALTD